MKKKKPPTYTVLIGSYFMNHVQRQYSAAELAGIGVDLLGER